MPRVRAPAETRSTKPANTPFRRPSPERWGPSSVVEWERTSPTLERFQVRSNRPQAQPPVNRRPLVNRPRRSRLARWAMLPIGGVVALVLAGCTQQQLAGFLPGGPGVTNNTERITSLWVNSWIVLLGVGLVTWGLIIWA